MLHFRVSVNHVSFCTINIITKLSNAHILAFYFRAKVLGLVLSGLDDSNDFVKLVILIPDHLLLVLKDLTVVKISSLVIFIILSTFILDLVLLRGECSLVVFHGTIVLSQLSRYDFFNLVD